MKIHATFTALLLTGMFLSGCGGSDSEAPAEPARDNSAEVQAYYEANPEFFSFKTPEDLPADLEWEDGSHLPEIGSPDARKGGTQYVTLQDFPRTLRTAGPDSNGSFRPFLLDDTWLRLAHVHPDTFEYYPGTARAWAIDMENRTVYVKLNPDARWNDGMPVTADDYFFMFFFYQSDYIVAPWYKNWYSTQYTNITKYDDYTFSITVPKAKPNLASRVLELAGMPRHFFKELGEDFVERYQWRNVPTPGPYVIREDDIRKGRSIAMTKVDGWWAKDNKFWRYRYNPDKVQFTVIREVPKVFEAFKRGDIDQFGLNLAEYWYEKLPDEDADVQNGYIHKSVFYNQRPRSDLGLFINTSQPLLDNRDIRVGIQYATNWDLVIEKFFRGDFMRLRTPSDGFAEFTHPTLTARPFDIDRALEAFAAAGFSERGPDGILVNAQGERLSFTLSTGYVALKDIFTILKEEAAKAGLEYRIEVLDGTAGWKKVQEKKHDIHFAGFGVFLELFPRYWDKYHSDNAYDDAFLADGSINPARKLKPQTNNLEAFAVFEMDGMIDAYRASDDKQEMIDLSHAMTERHYEHASWVPGYFQPFYRVGHWRWLRYPEFFNHKHSRSAGQYWIHWIDEDMKAETLQARKSGQAFEPQINVYDQFR